MGKEKCYQKEFEAVKKVSEQGGGEWIFGVSLY